MASFAGGVENGGPGRSILLHVLQCEKCRNILRDHCKAELGAESAAGPGGGERLRALSDGLLRKFMLKDSAGAWERLGEALAARAAQLESDVIAAAKPERARASIFFRALCPNDDPLFWQAEMYLPMDGEEAVTFRLAGDGHAPLRAEFLIICGLRLKISGGACAVHLHEFQECVGVKTLACEFPDGNISPGVPLFFEEI